MCPGGKVFSECASPCQKTCQNKNQNFGGNECKQECYSNCICPVGTFMDLGKNGTCVSEEECTCYYKNNYYKPGETVSSECNKWYYSLFKNSLFYVYFVSLS